MILFRQKICEDHISLIHRVNLWHSYFAQMDFSLSPHPDACTHRVITSPQQFQ